MVGDGESTVNAEQGQHVGYQLPISIGATLKKIQSRELVLPAIQREFVWKDRQIETLFDSLMRGYPIGSFLSWTVDAETAKQFKFYDFMREVSPTRSRAAVMRLCRSAAGMRR